MRIGLSYDQGTPKYRLYFDALLAAGRRFGRSIEPVWLAGSDRDLDRHALGTIDGLVLTGGADVEPARYGFEDASGSCATYPGRDAVEIATIEAAFDRGIPTLAICRGMQLLNVVRGGALVPDLPGHALDDAARHSVRVDPASRLGGIAGVATAGVSSSHHQAVAVPGEGLRVVASSPDGIVEAIERIDPNARPWLVAVQWHPERMSLDEPLAGKPYAAFLTAIAENVPVARP